MARLVLEGWEKVQACVSVVVDSSLPSLHAKQSHLWPEAHNLAGRPVEWSGLWYLSAGEEQWVFAFEQGEPVLVKPLELQNSYLLQGQLEVPSTLQGLAAVIEMEQMPSNRSGQVWGPLWAVRCQT